MNPRIPNLNLQKNEQLADLIYYFHCIVVAFIVFAPFTNIPALLILHITSCLSLMIHWISSSDICSLTIIEANLRGLDRKETVSHRFIAPIYNIGDSEWSTILWIVTFILMCISMYKLYHSNKFKISWECFNNIKNPSILQTLKCFQPLFFLHSDNSIHTI